MEVSLRDITAQQSDYDKTRPCGAVQAHVDSQDQRLGQGNGGMEIVDHCPLQRRLDVAVNRVVGRGGVFPGFQATAQYQNIYLSFRLCRLPEKSLGNLVPLDLGILLLPNLPSSVPVPCWHPAVH
jgi:hypothetical protein